MGRAVPGESSKFWLTVLSELEARGVADLCIVCCDGLTGLPDAIGVWSGRRPPCSCAWCYLIRASMRYAPKKDWAALTTDLRLIYTAVDAAAAAARDVFAERWSTHYPVDRKTGARTLGGLHPVPGVPA